jgi:hypothetical protein
MISIVLQIRARMLTAARVRMIVLSQRRVQSRRQLVLTLGGACTTALMAACRIESRTTASPTLQPATVATSATPDQLGSGTSRPSTTVTPQASSTLTAVEPLPQPVQHALLRAANDFAVEPDDVRLVSYTARDWPSPALGCPEEDLLYPQVVTPGFLVTISVAGQPVDYHTDSATTVVQCPG